MKRLIFICLIISLCACTENQRARSFGGTQRIELEPGQRLVNATWKNEDLWILIEPMPTNYTPQEKSFFENSSFGVMQGKVIFVESKSN